MNQTWRERRLVAGGVIVLITLLAYVPALHGGFIWDDDAHVTDSAALRTLHGLVTIWTKPGRGDAILSAGAHEFLGAIPSLAVEPVRVPSGERVAAGGQRDSVVAGSGAAGDLRRLAGSGGVRDSSGAGRVGGVDFGAEESAVGRVLPGSGPGVHAVLSIGRGTDGGEGALAILFLAFAFFVGAMLSKTVACTWPLAILLLTWWKRGGIGRRDVWLMAPFVAMGAVLGSIDGVGGDLLHGGAGCGLVVYDGDRALIAGRAVWFYAAKLAWPVNLAFVYPRWNIDAGQWWQWVFPLAAALVVVALWFGQGRMGGGRSWPWRFF